MKIALLSPAVWRTPPRQYGPWEQVVATLSEALIKQGIDVTLFATGDSVTSGELRYCLEKPYGEDNGADAKVSECLHISYLMEQADEFDIIHNNYDFLPLTYSKLIQTPMITTIHGFSSPLIIPVYKKYNDHCKYVSISNSDRSKELNYIATIYHGIDKENFSFQPIPKDYLLFFGRIHPEKGTIDAIEVAKKLKKKIILAGLIQDHQYFNEKIKPHINDDDVVYVGNAGPAQRNELLRNAEALLHLIHFNEPFGLSVAEAMMCGTPVIAYNRGSMPELIQDGTVGFLISNIEEAVEAVQQVRKINRVDCHQWAMDKFSSGKMARDYINVYSEILKY